MTKTSEYVGVILEDEIGLVAVYLRGKDQEPNPNQWSVFGRYLEEDEQPAKVAISVIEEILSISLSLEKLKPGPQIEIENQVYTLFYYVISNELDEAKLTEGVEWRWIDLSEIEDEEVGGKPIVDHHARFLYRHMSVKILSEYWLSRSNKANVRKDH